MIKRKPSNFTDHPFDSIFQNAESEIVARNIMVILSKTGNKWRELSWKEYKRERSKDNNFTISEEEYFNKVASYCKSPVTASLFSPHWNRTEKAKRYVKRKISNFFFIIDEMYNRIRKGYRTKGFSINFGEAQEITLSNGKKMYTFINSYKYQKAKELGLSIKKVSYEGTCMYSNINSRAKRKQYFPIKIDGVNIYKFISKVADPNEEIE